ncbi:glycoside hydrolase family 3 domain protein [Exiguobacterium sibiricum 255-15]|uniref:beta-N-acetylhexosaminidase n=1 Tax=Exiguobacterium sibiricum (strain DSM 17290 / CCUG 55495 / CIP 109462 / JCM 13490 / 255-15) TaxID=262543 RepID=B1YFC7_EXIS2|nr:glycoside hydrolase family 3 protein [Exiguobacterium sibiricum]ACB60803.1 glycoside hydrolase family 3 domain protein [Exiguobacterium sibiricum 255-15]
MGQKLNWTATLGLTTALLAASLPMQPVAAETTASVTERVDTQLEQMTLEQKIGQMIMPDFRLWDGANHTKLAPEVGRIIDRFDLGGVILFAENVSETEQTTKLVHDLREVVEQDPSNDIPLFVTIDQEGGIVTRLGTGTNLPGNMALGATRSSAYAEAAGGIIGSELHALGINVNFGPVLDVNNNPGNPVIGVRSFSSDPNLVGELGSAMTQGIQEQGVAATAKHFPGHGDTAVDSHYGLPVVDKSLAELKQLELIPFKRAIDEGIDMVMTGHIGMPQIEDEVVESKQGTFPLPATLSDDVITGVLREELGYQGLVITDALNMQAIADNFTESEAVIKTFKAGVDIALMPTILRSASDVTKLETIFDDVIKAVESGDLKEADIDRSVERILTLKATRGIWKETNDPVTLEEQLNEAKSVVGSPEHKVLERQMTEAAVTLVRNDRKTLPFKPKKGQTVLVLSPTKDQTDSMVKTIRSLEKNAGNLKLVNVLTENYGASTPHLNQNPALQEKINQADYLIVGSNVNNSAKLGTSSADHYVPAEVFRQANRTGKKSVLLSLRNPYDVAVQPDADAQLLVYGFKGDPNGPDSEAGNTKSAGPNLPAGIRAIFGEFVPQGKLPVDVPKFKDGTFQTDLYREFGDGFRNWNK